MSIEKNRNIVIERVQKEIIGPGSDIFRCKDDFSDEIIEEELDFKPCIPDIIGVNYYVTSDRLLDEETQSTILKK